MKAYCFLVCVLVLSACSSGEVVNSHNSEVVFSNIETDFIVEDINGYGCDEITSAVLNYVFENGNYSTQMDVHDNYSTVGCSIKGKLLTNNQVVEFTFDYGGIVNFDNGKIFVCGENCCQNNFQFCTWDREAENPNREY